MRPRTVGLIAALLLSACATLKPPAQLSPVGDIAWYSNQAAKVVLQIQQATLDAEAAGVLTREDRQVVGKYTEIAARAGEDLSVALRAGNAQSEGVQKALAILEQALHDLPSHLNEHARGIIQPYVDTALILLSVFHKSAGIYVLPAAA